MAASRALFIGRFQPFHNGHLAMARRILQDHGELIIGIGSAQYSHTGENPFTAAERFEMIHRALDAERIHNYHIILSLVPRFDAVYTNSALVIRLFKERGVRVLSLPMVEREELSGTEVRRRMFSGGAWETLVPAGVAAYIKEIDGVQRIKETYKYSTPYGTRENPEE